MDFEKLAENAIQNIIEKLEEAEIEVDFVNNILQIETDSGTYIINKHSASKQIWMVSPISGAKHFSYHQDKQKWIESGGLELLNILNKELSIELNIIQS